MKLMPIKDILPIVGKTLSDNAPKLLTAAGICGFVTSTILAVRATPVAHQIHLEYLEMHDENDHEAQSAEEHRDELRELVKNELKEIAPLYLPAIGVGAGAIFCVLYGTHLQTRRTAAVLTAYSLAEKTLEQYQSNVIERLGEDAHHEIMQKVSDKLASEEVPFDEDYSYLPEPRHDGEYLCYDRVMGKYFYSTKEKIREAESTMNRRLIDETMVRMSEFYYDLGIEDHSFTGEALGFEIERGGMDIYFTSMLDDQSRPCLVINYHPCLVEPRIFMK